MRQGYASRTVLEKKTEPQPRKVSEPATGQIGVSVYYKKDELHKGRGFKAPMHSQATHKSGSQGRH